MSVLGPFQLIFLFIMRVIFQLLWMTGNSWLGVRHCDIQLVAYLIFCADKYSWPLFWDRVNLLESNLIFWVSSFLYFVSFAQNSLSLGLILPYYWGKTLLGVFSDTLLMMMFCHCGWQKQTLFPAISELWWLVPLILLYSSSPNHV